jgi:DNA-binding transcriptional regulator YiaG
MAERQAADDIMAGVRQLRTILAAGKRPEDVLTVRTIEVIAPPIYSAKQLRAARYRLGLSTPLFAGLMGVSKKLVEHWEAGRRTPSPMACRLLDAIEREPSAFIKRTVRKPAKKWAA